jgi:hypothetical protein
LDIPKPKFELVEIKTFTQTNNFNKTIKKYHQKHLKVTTQVHKKEVKYIQRNVTTLQQHINMSRIPTFIE